MDNNELENQTGCQAENRASADAAAPAPGVAPDYLAAAKAACDAGDDVLGMHLYLAAYETEAQGAAQPTPVAVSALRSAWNLAISLKERSIAEYIFEKMEPHISAREMGECADALQRLALDRLEQFGLSREELEGMADALSDDFFGGPLGEPSIHIEQFTIPAGSRLFGDADAHDASPAGASGAQGAQAAPAVPQDAFPPASSALAPDAEQSAFAFGAPGTAAASGAEGNAAQSVPPTGGGAVPDASAEAPGGDAAAPAPAAVAQPAEAPASADNASEKYDDLAGFASTIEDMHKLGIGVKDDDAFSEFVERLGALYGIGRARVADTILFSCQAREDANRFLEATVHELDLPVIRMSFEEGMQGSAALVIASEGIDVRGRQAFMRFGFTRPTVLVLSDIDTWHLADFEASEDRALSAQQMGAARAMHEAINLIRSGAANPEVYVLASVSGIDDIEPVLVDALYPATVVDIDLPTEAERRDIWESLKAKHPTLSRIQTDDLVRVSEGMPRYDMAQATREAIEDAYRRSLITRTYQPVTPQNIFEKIAAYQPLDSKHYTDLEDMVIEDFRRDLAHLDDILKEGQ